MNILSLLKKRYAPVKSGDYCRCDNCGNVGHVYGVAGSLGISAPFCRKCGKNNKLVRLEKK